LKARFKFGFFEVALNTNEIKGKLAMTSHTSVKGRNNMDVMEWLTTPRRILLWLKLHELFGHLC
jgi:hypothetical protein